jgi:hypothetical protein
MKLRTGSSAGENKDNRRRQMADEDVRPQQEQPPPPPDPRLSAVPREVQKGGQAGENKGSIDYMTKSIRPTEQKGGGNA